MRLAKKTARRRGGPMGFRLGSEEFGKTEEPAGVPLHLTYLIMSILVNVTCCPTPGALAR